MATSEELLKKAYADNNTATQAALAKNYNEANANLDEQKIASQRNTDANLNRTAVEAQKARNNYAETANAYGLTSGAMAQARLAQNNQQLANMTTLRAQQQENDAQAERQRGLLKNQYQAAIQEAQAKGDSELAMRLYEVAREREKALEDEQNRREAATWNYNNITKQQAADEEAARREAALWNYNNIAKQQAADEEAARRDAELWNYANVTKPQMWDQINAGLEANRWNYENITKRQAADEEAYRQAVIQWNIDHGLTPSGGALASSGGGYGGYGGSGTSYVPLTTPVSNTSAQSAAASTTPVAQSGTTSAAPSEASRLRAMEKEGQLLQAIEELREQYGAAAAATATGHQGRYGKF